MTERVVKPLIHAQECLVILLCHVILKYTGAVLILI